jgi:hypothetical protein
VRTTEGNVGAREVGRLHRHFILARRQVGELVKALVVALRVARQVGRLVARGDGRVHDDRARRIAHETLQVGGVGLRLREGRARTREREQADEDEADGGRAQPHGECTHVYILLKRKL